MLILFHLGHCQVALYLSTQATTDPAGERNPANTEPLRIDDPNPSSFGPTNRNHYWLEPPHRHYRIRACKWQVEKWSGSDHVGHTIRNPPTSSPLASSLVFLRIPRLRLAGRRTRNDRPSTKQKQKQILDFGCRSRPARGFRSSRECREGSSIGSTFFSSRMRVAAEPKGNVERSTHRVPSEPVHFGGSMDPHMLLFHFGIPGRAMMVLAVRPAGFAFPQRIAHNARDSTSIRPSPSAA